MKKLMLFFVLSFSLSNWAVGQTSKLKYAVLNLDVQGYHTTPTQAGNMARLELEKLDSFEVVDKYDVSYLLSKDSTLKKSINYCYGKQCLVEVGKSIKVDKILTGSIENYGETTLVTLRIINVKDNKIEKTQINEYLHLPEQLPLMVRLTLRNLYGLKNDAFVVQQMTQKKTQETYLNNTYKRLRADGPRMGATYFLGELASRLRENEQTGGFGAFPLMFQFGYQFEKQYLNEGKFQALFEFIPMLTGIDQGYFIPSLTLLNGLRNNKSGWEFAFGPSIRLIQQAEGYYDPSGKWILSDSNTPSSQALINRLDSRGKYNVQTGFVLAFGKTIRSGRLNIPMNIYAVPHKEGLQVGFSFGFNAKN